MNPKGRVYAALRREPTDRAAVFMWFYPGTADRLRVGPEQMGEQIDTIASLASASTPFASARRQAAAASGGGAVVVGLQDNLAVGGESDLDFLPCIIAVANRDLWGTMVLK